MPSKKQSLCLLALLLGVTFLAAQLHYCVDLAPLASNTHFCPICSTAGHAVATTTPDVTVTPATQRLEMSLQRDAVSLVPLREVAPRGPPTV